MERGREDGSARTESPEVLVERRGPCLELRLHRPERLNALTREMGRLLAEALRRAGEDPEVRVVTLRGDGRAFCSGGDVAEMHRDIQSGRPSAYFREPLAAVHAAARAIRECPKPVVAILHGVAAGAGLNLALCCDYRIAAEDVRLIQAFTNIGLAPDTGGSWLLPRLVGLARATELLFEGRTVDGREAQAIGLVHRAIPVDRLEEEARLLVERLAARPTRALGATKALLDAGAFQSFERQLEQERAVQERLGEECADYQEGLRAFAEKRPPHFRGA